MSRWQSMTIARDEGTDQCSLATAVALRAPSAAKEHLIAISPVNDVMALLVVHDVMALINRVLGPTVSSAAALHRFILRLPEGIRQLRVASGRYRSRFCIQFNLSINASGNKGT